ncbi:MAG: hypothetical protein Q8885_00195 [Candidatus Phytoplasma stylosanthis]|nr:hypothetical protein [Candidatus Phytoplasma stylosanthis]
MLSPLNILSGLFSFQNYFTWFIISLIIIFIFFFIDKICGTKISLKHKFFYILIILSSSIVIWFFIFREKESVTQNYDKLILEVDKTINKYDDLLDKYKGLASNWEKEMEVTEKELKILYESQKITEADKEKIKNIIENNEKTIEKIKLQLNDVQGEIVIEKGRLIDLEKEKIKIEEEIKQKEKELKKEQNEQKKDKLYKEIEELQKKQIKIVEEITNTKIKIKKLETTEESLIKQLEIAKSFKENMIQSMNRLDLELKKIASQIISVEDKKREIQENMNSVKNKMEEIKTEKEAYQVLKYNLLLLRQNAEDWERNNAFSLGNLFKVIFKAFNKINDLLSVKTGFNIVNQNITFDRKSEQDNQSCKMVIAKEHRIHKIIDFLTQKNGEEPKMISAELLKIFINDINKDLEKLEQDYFLYEEKYNNYKNKINSNELIEEIRKLKIQTYKENDKEMMVYSEWISEYEKSIEELEKKRAEFLEKEKHVNLIDNLQKQKNKIEENIQEKELEYTELQQQNPNYEKIQKIILENKNKKTEIKVPQFQIQK